MWLHSCLTCSTARELWWSVAGRAGIDRDDRGSKGNDNILSPIPLKNSHQTLPHLLTFDSSEEAMKFCIFLFMGTKEILNMPGLFFCVLALIYMLLSQLQLYFPLHLKINWVYSQPRKPIGNHLVFKSCPLFTSTTGVICHRGNLSEHGLFIS